MLKNPSESFDEAQDERRGVEIIEDFPFMLRFSKHSEPFFSNLLEIFSLLFAPIRYASEPDL
jgi:hypothetical protein